MFLGRFFPFLLSLLMAINVHSQVLINEVQSSNTTTIKDEFNEYPDWIELINNSTESVNLQGWHLSDSKNSLTKWSFPAVQLAPSQLLLVFSSGRNINQVSEVWNTIIDKGADWKYIVPSDTVSSNWKNLSYSDNNWLGGPSGFGYADNDDASKVDSLTLSVYARKVFNLESINTIDSVILHVDYDDGFVAYLNGVEVARANLGTAGSAVSYNQLASPDHEALMKDGFPPTKFNITAFKNLLVAGENILAIEVHNNSTTSTDLSLIPFLTFGQSSEGENYVGPSSYLNFGSQSLHTNFKLKADGEVVILSNSAGEVVDSINPPAMQADYSYGRLSSNVNQFNYFNVPTPGTANSSAGLNVFSDDRVNYSVAGGYHTSGFSVKLTSPISAPIYYTTDGSEPTSGSSLYTSSIYISGNTVLKSRVLQTGYMDGTTHASTYITERKTDLPMTCLSTAPDNLWDYYTGMYVMGPNASASNPYFGANFWMDWEKPFRVEIYSTSNQNVINQGAGASIFGGWSRANAQRSFAIAARKTYGDSDFDYPLFVTQPSIDKYKSFVLRNAGNDWNLAFIRDGLMTELTARLGVEHQALQPTATYLNGEYWGIYDMREKVNEDFLAGHWFVDPDDVTLLTNNAEVLEGSNTEYVSLTNYLNTNASLAASDKYKYVSDRIDIDNYIKYQLIQIYVDNEDWPGNNIKYWKTSHPQSKWRWILYDTDFGFGLYNSASYQTNTIAFALEPNGSSWPNPSWSTLLFRRLITNDGFRNDFINQMCDNINTTFDPDNVDAHVDSLFNVYKNEMPYHKTRWGQSYDAWGNEVNKIKEWGGYRPDYMFDFLYSTFELKGYAYITLQVSNQEQGKIRLNTITPDSYPFWGQYFIDIPVEMEAIPAPGYKFIGWENGSTSTERIISYTPHGDGTFKANFAVATAEDVSLVINEINYNSSDDWTSGDWVEIYNNGSVTVDLSGYKLSDSNQDSGYVFLAGTQLTPGKFLVVTKKYSDFRKNYPYVLNSIGDFEFGLSSLGDEIRLYDAQGKVLDAVDYMSTSPWPNGANGTGITLELKAPSLDNSKPENWIAVKQQGTPGAVNSLLTSVSEPFLTNKTDKIISAFPNKFSDYTTISFTLPSSANVKIDVVDLQGRVITTLADGFYKSGENYTDWTPAGNVAGGVYIIRLLSDKYSEISKVIYLK